MNKIIYILAVIVILNNSLLANKPLKIVYNSGTQPLKFTNSKAQADGMLIDIWKLWSVKNNIDIEFIEASWDDTINMIKDGRADIHAGIYYTKQRDQFLDYPKKPIYENKNYFFYDESISNINSNNDLKPFVIGIGNGYPNKYMKNIYPTFAFKSYKNATSVSEALVKNEVKVILSAMPTFLYYLNSNNIDQTKYKYNKKTFAYTKKYFGAVKQGNKKILKLINDGFENIKDTELQDIELKWTSTLNQNLLSMPNHINLTPKEQMYLKNKKLLKVHNEMNWAPFNFNEDGIVKGFSVDYMNLLAKKLDIKVEYISGYSWSQFMDMLLTPKLDLIINIVKDENRLKQISFTNGYYITQNVIYSYKDNEHYNSIEDLENKTIAIPKEFFIQNVLRKKYPNIKQVLVKNQLEALKLLSLGKVDAVFGKKVVIDYLIANNNISGVIPTGYIDNKQLISNLRIGASKKDQILIDILTKTQKYISQKEFNNLKHKWFGINTQDIYKLSSQEQNYLKKKQILKVCTNPNWQPIEFTINDKPQGISIDTVNLVANKLNLNVEYIKTTSWKQSQKFLEEKKCDILPAAIKTKNRERYANFTKSYLNYDLAIITKNDKPLVTKLKDIIDKPMSRKKSSGLVYALKAKYPNIDIKETKGYKESFELVASDDVYFTIATLPVLDFYKKKYKLDTLQIAGYTKMKYNLSVAVRKDDKILLSCINKILAIMPKETQNIIHEKWTNKEIVEELDYSFITQVILIIMIIILFIIYRNAELRKHNKKLKQQKELHDLVFENSSNGVLIIDTKTGKFTDCNNQIVKILKYNSKEDILDLHPSSLSPQFQPDGRSSQEKANEMIGYAIENGSNTFEWKHIRATGEEFWAEIILTSITIDSKDMIHVVWKDIDERKKTREKLEELNQTLEIKVKQATINLEQQNFKLQESIDNFQNVLDTTMEAIVLIDETKHVIDINLSGIHMLGYDKKSDIIGTNIVQHVVQSEMPKLQEAMKHDIAKPYELMLIKKDGTTLHTLASARNIIIDDKPIRMSTLMDLTEIKAKEKLLQQQSRLAQMGEMISMIAHQWRQPLGAISTTTIGIETKLILKKFDLSNEDDRDKFQEFLSIKLKDINGFVQSLSTTIDDFRNFFKPDKAKEIVSLFEPINRALKIVETSMSSKGINISCDFTNDEKLLIYQNEVMQVILNILKNSEDNFIEKKIINPQIKITTLKSNNNYIIDIYDNGGGIAEDILPKIFDPYFSTKDEKNGTGLGLYMSKIIIEEHNSGKLIVENIDDGICFKMIFTLKELYELKDNKNA